MKNKKGSHVGFAIAFILFVGFVIFLFSLISPAGVGKVEEDKDFLLEHLQNEIIENTSAELTTLSLVPTSSGDCFDLSGLNGLKANLIAKDENRNILDSTGNNVETNSFVKIYSSDESFNSPPSIACSNFSNYDLGLTRTNKYVFETKILELINYYNASSINYENLKIDFGIPNANDFDFGFIYANGTKIPESPLKIPPEGTDVFAEETPVIYVNKDADIEVGHVRGIIW